MIDLLELQRLTRELLDHLTAMFPWRTPRTYCGDGGTAREPGTRQLIAIDLTL